MKRKLFFAGFIILSALIFGNLGTPHALADTAIHLKVATNDSTLYDQDITVAPCDSDNAGTLMITPYCAILQSGLASDWDWTWAPSAFLNSLGGIAGFTSQDADGNDVYHYWSWSLNSIEAMVALNQYELLPADSILLTFIDPAIPAAAGAPAGNAGPILPPPFDIEKALNYLKSVQGPDGSFGGEGLYTDWAAIAFGAANVAGEPVEKITSYFSSHNQISPLLTDNERRAMALLALGLNPYDWHGVNYIEAILESWDGSQFGNPELVNDDIFALLPLQRAGFTVKNDMIKKDLAFIIGKQRRNGSWEDSVDMTAAAIVALRPLQENNNGVYDSLTQAMSYMFNNQGATGGWDSVYSTSWAAQAMHSVDASWVKYGYSPSDYLSLEQAADGGMLPVSATLENRVWATSYAIPAVLGKSWNEILRPATRPALPETIQSTEVKNTQATPVISPAQITQDNPVEILPEIPTEITAAVLTAEVIDSLPSDGNSSAGNLPVVLSLLGGAILIILLGKLFLV